ncbi:hypothetical protein IW261DRAFT_355041 [Armillaria novae-zelandiae]|uniref:Uncharacterized protein n=1 Tax=Armillaria novae-zelandiae TaxID=153914 RepID=A0AA39PQH6_9AGAR|nr:hypothetical protein IW261DRAFT_355041 [Armillaria novae-zelandiae]
MFPYASFSLSSFLYVLVYSMYRASTPSTDVSRRGEVLVPAVVFDCRVLATTNGDLDLSVCDATAAGAISGLLEPIVFTTTRLDSSTGLLDELEIAVDDAPQGIIRQLLEPTIFEAVSAVAVVLVPAATTSIDDTPRSVSVPHQPTQPSLRVARAQSNLRTFKSLAVSVFVVVVVASLTVVFKQAFRLIDRRFFRSILIPASRPWRSSFPDSSAQVSVFTMFIMVFISFVMGFLARGVSFEQLSAVLDTLHPLFIDLCSCLGAMASCTIESAVCKMVDACVGSGSGQGEVVMENILVLEEAEHVEASADTASLLSESVCIDTVEPSRTSVSIQAMPEVEEFKDVSIGTDPVSRTSIGVQCEPAPVDSKDVSIGTDPVSRTSIGVQCESAPVESKDISIGTDPVLRTSIGIQGESAPVELQTVCAPGESRGSVSAPSTEGNSPPQTMAAPDVFSVPAVTSIYNLYTMAPMITFPSVEDLARTPEFERLRREIQMLGETESVNPASLSASALGPPPPSLSESTSTSIPTPRRKDGFEYFDPSFGPDARHLWSREFWYLFLRNKELTQTVYDALLPVQWAKEATDEDKSKMEMGLELVRSYARQLSEHATNPILLLPGNILPEEDEDDDESSVVSAEDQPTIDTSGSLTSSSSMRSPSPFVRPSNPQSRFLDSSEASVAAPSIRQRISSPSRRRPGLAQITNAPRTVRPLPSRTPMKIRGIRGSEQGVPTPPPSLRPKLARRTNRFPLAVPTTGRKDESDSPSRPARIVPPSSSKLPRWRG